MLAGFDQSVRQALVEFLERHHNSSERKVAVFDADGTLWRGDVGDAFFMHQLDRQTVPGAPRKDPFKKYLDESQTDNAAEAYGWLAQWNAGVREDVLLRWADDFFKENWVKNIFSPMRDLSHELLNAGFEIWVVSASIRWIVEVGVKGFGIQSDQVIGSSVLIENGTLTETIENMVPYRGAKAKLIEKIIGVKPLLAGGNTYWDKEMLNTASELALTISSEEKGTLNYDSEQRLRRLAESNNLTRRARESGPAESIWLIQRF